MPLLSLNEFQCAISPDARLLALDVSKSAIGIATGSISLKAATPVTVIKRGRLSEDAAKLAKIINDYEIAGLIIGWPLHADGTEGKRCQAVRDTMTEIFRQIISLPALCWDERFTTAEAYNLLDNSGISRGKHRDNAVDSLAATLILQSYLDRKL